MCDITVVGELKPQWEISHLGLLAKGCEVLKMFIAVTEMGLIKLKTTEIVPTD